LFYQILLLDANRELEAQSFESAQARYEQSAALAAAGQASRLDEFSARVDMENQRPLQRNADMLYENALDSFKTILGLPREQAVTLKGTLDYEGAGITGGTVRGESLDSQAALAAITTYSLQNKAVGLDTAGLLKSIEALEAQRKAAINSAYVPALRLAWNASPVYSNDTWADSGGSFSASLKMSLDNLLPWSTAKTQIDAVGDSIRAAQIQLSETLQTRESRIAQYTRTIEKTKETIEAAKLNVELAQSAYEMYEEAYRKGAADYQQLRNAADSLLQAQNQVQQEQYTFISAILDLEKEYNIPFGTL
jgi:outer membrane protein TolC